ncbi:MAG: hypothetical protein JNK26_02600 [Candidatus Doudnabacteria bacterium]|nr:hypothetical protein [Candidatus Doudnabacteria bacterium]
MTSGADIIEQLSELLVDNGIILSDDQAAVLVSGLDEIDDICATGVDFVRIIMEVLKQLGFSPSDELRSALEILRTQVCGSETRFGVK